MGKYDKYQSLADKFNKKYGLNFSYEKFETDVLRKKNMQG